MLFWYKFDAFGRRYLQFSSQIIDSNVELVNLEKPFLEFDIELVFF